MSDGHDLAVALAPHHDAILSQLALAWRAHAPKSTVMLGSPQRAFEAADAIGTAWFDWLDNINDLAVIRELAARLMRQDLTYAIASSLAQALSAAVTQATFGDDQHAAIAEKLTRHFSAAFLDQVAMQHELHTRQAQERLAMQLQASAEVGRAATSILDTDQLLREVVNLITDRFGFYYAAVFTLDHTGQYAVLREATGKAGEILKNLNHKLDIHSQSMVGAVITSQRPRIAAGSEQDPLRFSNPLLPETRSEIALPLVVGDQILGALDVQSTEPHAFDEISATVLQNMADQIAIALENARLFEQAQANLNESQTAQANLARNQAQLSEALRIAQLGNWSYDVPTDTFTFNDQFYALMHTTADRAGGYTMSSAQYSQRFVHPDDAPIVGMEIVKALETTDPNYRAQIDHRVYFGDGELGYITVRFTIEKDAQGRTIRTQGANQDITERKLAEEALKETEERFRIIAETTPVPILISGAADGIVLYGNDQLGQLFGTPIADLIGRQTPDFYFDPADRQRLLGQMRRDGFLRDYEVHVKRVDGTPFWVLVSMQPLVFANQRALFAAFLDITASRQAAEELRRSQAQLSEALRIAQLGYWEYDVARDAFLFNDQFYSLFRTTAEAEGGYEMPSATYARKFVHPDDAPIVGQEIGLALQSTDLNYSRQIDHRIFYADGQPGYIIVRFRVDHDTEGRPVKFIGANEDITARRRIELDLAQERNLLRTLIDTLPERIFAKDLDSRFTLANTSEIHLDGASSFEELRGKNDFDFYPVDLAQQYYDSERPILVEGQSLISYEERSVDQDGNTRWHVSTKVPLRDANQQIVGLVGMTRDITAMKEAEAEREQLLTDQQQRALQLQTAAEVGRVATSILNPDQLLGEIVKLIATRFGFYHVAVFTVDESGRWALLRDATGEVGQLLKDRGQALAIRGQSIVGSAIRQRQSRIALDVGAEAVQFNDPLLPDTHSEIALPLFVGDQVLGALDIHSTAPAAFDDNLAILLQGMADQIAVALNNAEQYQREQAHVEQTNRLMRIVIDLSERTDRAGLLTRLVRSALTLLDTDRAQFWLKGVSGLELKAAQSVRPGADQSLAISQELADRVCRTGLPLRLDSSPVQAGYASRITDVPFNAALITPISWQGTTTGVLSVMRSQPGRPFTQDDENSAQLLAAQAAAALENITLAEQQQHRAVQLQTAAEVSRASSTFLQLEELLNTVVELVRDNFNLYYVGTFLLDEQAEWAYLRAGTGEAGRKMLQAGHRLRVDESSMIGWSIVHRQARIALDVGTDAAHFDNPLLPNTRSEMALPLISRGRIIGAATIQSTQPAAFTPDDISILQTMADQITTAAENARLFEQTQQRAAQLLTVSEVGTASSTILEPLELMRTVVQLTQRRFNLYHCHIFLLDDAEQILQVKACGWREGDEHYGVSSDRIIRFDAAQSLVARAARSRQTVIVNNVRTEPGWLPNPLLPEIQSEMALPMVAGDRLLGVFNVHSDELNHFTQEDANILAALATQTAIALQNARLYEQTRQAVDELNALNRRLTGEAWQSYVQTRSPDAVIWHANDSRLHQAGSEQAEQLAAGKVAVQHLEGEAEISVPITLRGQLIGALRFRAPADKWTDDAKAMATSVAGHLAQAAENTRLIEQTQHTARREKQIAQAADRIHRESDLDAILQTAVEEIIRITGATDVGIQLGAASTFDPEHHHDHQPNGRGEPTESERVSTLA